MTIEQLPFFEKGLNFAPIFQSYIQKDAKLEGFYGRYPEIENFEAQIKDKSFSSAARIRLQDVLQKQYSDLQVPEAVSRNIEVLAEDNAFTVTTGHQLNIFTGPLYFIYKIVTVINLSRKLAETYPDVHFVPVYWMATEDHDFEEINHFHLFNKTYTWNNGGQKGAVGRMDLQGMKELLKDLPEAVPLFEKAYTTYDTLANATRHFVNELFGEYGLIVVDADDKTLKSAFTDIIKDDLLNHTAKKKAEDTSSRLDEMDLKTQIFPREINFFYLKDGLRERITKEDGGNYTVLNTDISFSQEQLNKEIEEYPERFSPNVVMRPVFQEHILPNLAYIGGPAEVAYWLQLKAVFEHYKIPFPILLPRNFALIINKTNAKKLRKLPVATDDLFKPFHELKEQSLKELSDNELSLKQERNVGRQLFESIFHKAAEVDPSLKGFAGAEEKKFLKSLDNIEKRIKKAEEQRLETSLGQLEKLKEKLFPEDTWQERYDNFLNFYLNNESLLEFLLENLDPLDFSMNVITEEDE